MFGKYGYLKKNWPSKNCLRNMRERNSCRFVKTAVQMSTNNLCIVNSKLKSTFFLELEWIFSVLRSETFRHWIRKTYGRLQKRLSMCPKCFSWKFLTNAWFNWNLSDKFSKYEENVSGEISIKCFLHVPRKTFGFLKNYYNFCILELIDKLPVLGEKLPAVLSRVHSFFLREKLDFFSE